nr:LTA synthase family protein [Bacillus sp. REN3]
MSVKKFFWFAAGTLWIKIVAVSLAGFNLHLSAFADFALILLSPIGAVLVLLGLGLRFGGKRAGESLLLVMMVVTGILYGDLLYYRFYTDFVTVPILFQFKNVGGLGPSTLELMSPWDVFLFTDLFIAAWIIWKDRKKEERLRSIGLKRYLVFGLFLSTLALALGTAKSPYFYKEAYNRTEVVKSIGLFQYHLFDIGSVIITPLNRFAASKADAEASMAYAEAKGKEQSDLFGAAKGKNLIMISMESTQDFVIGQKVNGEEITPFLNSLVKESYYFSQIYEQTAQGKTSDSEFMIDTGLYPLSGGSVFVRKPENTYQALPHILKENGGYRSVVFHGNEATFWNRETMYQSLGYDRFYSESDYEVTTANTVNYGIKDIPFFQQSLPYLEGLPQPFYARFITLTNHFPYLLDEEDKLIPEAETTEAVVNRYVTTVRYQDEAIKTLFESLKRRGLYENTLFVLYGDHYGISDQYEDGVMELLGLEDTSVNRAELKQVPLIIHVPGQEGAVIPKIGGEIDIRATVLHLLGIESGNNLSLGQNLFNRKKGYPVIFRDGSFITEQLYYDGNSCYERDKGSLAPSSGCNPYKEIVRKELGTSDQILHGDLFRFLE